jgi:O-antigen/teichoic acid export membrane protein
MLKIGIIGMAVMYWAFYRFWKKGIRRYHAQRNTSERIALLAILLMLVIFVPNFVYYTRLKFLVGIALAGIAAFTEGEEIYA